jgi:hypothetical protein
MGAVQAVIKIEIFRVRYDEDRMKCSYVQCTFPGSQLLDANNIILRVQIEPRD